MKKTSLLLITVCAAAAAVAQPAFATITLSASPLSQTAAAGGTFNVDISLQITQSTAPSNFDGYNLFLDAALIQNAINISGLFTVTAAVNHVDSWQLAGSGPPDALTTGTQHSTFVWNHASMGFTDASFGSTNSVATPITTPLLLETLTISIANSVVPGTYNFATTGSAFVDGGWNTAVNDTGGTLFNVDNPATFSITVVPEPATWSLIGLGGLSSLGLTLLRRRHRA